MSHTQTHGRSVVEQLNRIPEKRLAAKVKSTVVGVGSVALGVGSQGFALFPLWVNLLVIFFGGFAISKELVKAFVGFAPAAIRDFKDAITNGRK